VDAKLRGIVAQGDFPANDVAVTIGRFTAGHALLVSKKRREETTTRRRRGQLGGVESERLEGFDEIWVLCHRRPGAGWRLAGRYLERDVLVLFRIYDKRDIGNDYSSVVKEVIADWDAWLRDIQPCRGPWLSGYTSREHRDADER
jgi:hypothetical protein